MNRAEIWIKMEQDRLKSLPTAQRIFAENLQKAYRPVIDNIAEQSHAEQALEASPSFFDSDYLQRGYEEMYEAVMPKFIRRRFQALKKSHKEEDQRWLRLVRQYIQSGEIANRIKQVSETSKDRVRSIIESGIEEGMGAAQIARNVDKLGFDELIRNRSTVIARTETINASNRGDIIGARETNLNLKKEWLTTIDGRERKWHRAADGIRANMEEDFIVGGEGLDYPGDPKGSARNVIQCRCTQTYIEK